MWIVFSVGLHRLAEYSHLQIQRKNISLQKAMCFVLRACPLKAMFLLWVEFLQWGKVSKPSRGPLLSVVWRDPTSSPVQLVSVGQPVVSGLFLLTGSWRGTLSGLPSSPFRSDTHPFQMPFLLTVSAWKPRVAIRVSVHRPGFRSTQSLGHYVGKLMSGSEGPSSSASRFGVVLVHISERYLTHLRLRTGAWVLSVDEIILGLNPKSTLKF